MFSQTFSCQTTSPEFGNIILRLDQAAWHRKTKKVLVFLFFVIRVVDIIIAVVIILLFIPAFAISQSHGTPRQLCSTIIVSVTHGSILKAVRFLFPSYFFFSSPPTPIPLFFCFSRVFFSPVIIVGWRYYLSVHPYRCGLSLPILSRRWTPTPRASSINTGAASTTSEWSCR